MAKQLAAFFFQVAPAECLASTAPMFLPKNFLDRGYALPSHSRCDPHLPDRASLPPGGSREGEGGPILPIPERSRCSIPIPIPEFLGSGGR